MLSLQYRMHPELSLFPSDFFYNRRLKDGPLLLNNRKAEWHQNAMFPPYKVFDVKGREETNGRSYFNAQEVTHCVQLVKYLCASYPQIIVKFI